MLRIGPIVLSFSLLLHLALFIVLGLGVFRLYMSARFQRLEGLRTPQIKACLVNGPSAYGKGIEYCQELLSVRPGHIPARLHLGTFAEALGRNDEARQAFETVLKNEQATPTQKAYAATALAALELKESGLNRTAGRKAAEPYLEKALTLAPEQGTASVIEAALLLWNDTPQDTAAAQQILNRIAQRGESPSRPALSRMYYLQGLAHARLEQSEQAAAAMQAASFLDPDWSLPRRSRNASVIAGVAAPEMDLDRRSKLIEEYRRKLATFGDDEGIAVNAMAIGLWRMKKDLKPADYRKKQFNDAVSLLRQYLRKKPDDEHTLRNLAGLYLDLLFGSEPDEQSLISDLNIESIYGLEKINPWLEQGKRQDDANLRRIQAEIAAFARPALKAVQDYLALSTPVRSDALLAQLHILNLHQVLAATEHLPERRNSQLVALETAIRSLRETGTSDPDALRIAGTILLRLNNPKEAIDLLNQAVAAGSKSPALIEALAGLAQKPSFFDLRPRSNRWWGRTPLIGATLRIPGDPDAFQATLNFNGQALPFERFGTQLLFLASEKQAQDGTHRIGLSVRDSLGNLAEKTFDFYIDAKPPQVTLPEPSVTVGNPVWTIELNDSGSGLDLSSLSVRFQSAEKANSRNDELIREGRYRWALPALNIEVGKEVTEPSVRVTPLAIMPPGEYSLIIRVSDRAGNRASKQFPVQLR